MAYTRPVVALLFMMLLAGHEVHVMGIRINQSEDAQERKSSRFNAKFSSWPGKDLDLEGCKAYTKRSCEKKDGCQKTYLWLDKPGHSCRYTDEYKLRQDKIATFLPVEMTRLEAKSKMFAETGCMFGGTLWKCHRRMQQILRLFNYVRKARDLALELGKIEPEHPAYKFAQHPGAPSTQEDLQQRIAQVGTNLAEGFSKNKNTKGLCMKKGLEKLLEIPSKIEQLKKDAASANVTLTEATVEAHQQAEQTAAMFAVMCANVEDGAVKEMAADIEAAGPQNATGPTDPVDTMVEANEKAFAQMNTTGRKILKEMDGKHENQDDSDGDEGETDETASALLDMDSEFEEGADALKPSATGGPLKILLVSGPGWLLTHGIGWLWGRLVWTFIFMICAAFNLGRVVLLPILMIGCTLLRALWWVGYDLLWEGDTSGAGAREIKECPAMSFRAVGFETGKDNQAEQIFMDPVRIASEVSGVYHPFKDVKPPNPCENVTCGQGAACYGRTLCHCRPGQYPLRDGVSCGPALSKHGCVCRPTWDSSFGTKYHGCSSSGKCKVEASAQCQAALKVTNDGFGEAVNFVRSAFGAEKKFDTCQWQKGFMQVNAIVNGVNPLAVDASTSSNAKFGHRGSGTALKQIASSPGKPFVMGGPGYGPPATPGWE